MTQIHPSAIVEKGAHLGEGCKIGPFCVVGANVVLGDRVELKSHVVVTGQTEIGDDTVIYSFAVIGEIPQDLKFGGEETRLVIGQRNRIREHVTMNTGTEGGGGVTRIGDDCLFMAGAHVAHDVQIGNRVIMVNHSGAAGHAVMEDDVILGGISGLHQFVRVGRGAIIGALTMVPMDVIPYGLVHASRGQLEGLNLVGLKRRGFSREAISDLRAAFRQLGESSGPMASRAAAIATNNPSDEVREIIDFITAGSDRHFLTPVL
ncbi:MAG: acyl-ACP--UDP-N-acetylglucosamine O-acyltransferase [Marinibacterium sp.]|nr:acyl-ACP--UDP-N-acetylglucosamine O-acyltransferase [Marinibacterium sp.]